MAKVLVVERDSVFAVVLEDRLRVAGHDVLLLAELARTPAAAQEHHADLVVLDTGPSAAADAVAALRAQAATRTVPVLVLSDRAEAPDRVAALRAGADDYLARPIDLEELLLRADRLLGSRAPEQMLQGDLRTHPLWAVLQYLQQVRKSGSLRVRGGSVDLRAGEPVAARWQTLRGREALLALLCAEEGSFRFETDERETPSTAATAAEALPVGELLMHTAWLKDELEQRRQFLPGTGEPLHTLTEFLPTIGEEFGDLPLQEVLTRIHRQPGVRLFDLMKEGTEAPLTTRLSVAWLVEHGLVAPREKVPESAPQNTLEISSALVFDVAVATLAEAAGRAGFDTASLSYLVLAEPGVWPALRLLIEEAPGFRTNEDLRRLVEQVELRRAGSAAFSTSGGGLVSLHVQTLTRTADPQIDALVPDCAGVLTWLDGTEALATVQGVVRRLEPGKGSGMLVAATPAAQQEAERLTRGSRRWRISAHAPRSLLGLFRLLQPATS